MGNCILLDDFEILHCSSSTKNDPIDTINDSHAVLYKDIILPPQTHHLNDHEYILTSNQFTMSNYQK